MPYAALATDYDGTIARDGRVDEATLAALGRLEALARVVQRLSEPMAEASALGSPVVA